MTENMKIKATNWGKIFVTYIIKKALYEVYKELLLINKKGKRNKYKFHRRGSTNGSSICKNGESH